MIKSVIFPNQVFQSKEELFDTLKANEKRVIDIKKAQVYKSCEKGHASALNLDINKVDGAVKNVGFEADKNSIYPIISTTNYFDSHKDVHFYGSMTKTAKEQQGKVMYALDHELKYNSILAWQKDVNMFIADVPWAVVGKSYEGNTQALIFGIKKDAIRNKEVLSDIENMKMEFENSIRMVYYKITMGMNSEKKEHKENKDYFDSRIDLIANKEDAIEDGYFFGVEELGIHKEGSLVVAGGSNDATAIYINTQAEKSLEIEESEPTKVTPQIITII